MIKTLLPLILGSIFYSTVTSAQDITDLRLNCIKQVTGRVAVNGRTPYVPDIHQPAIFACVQKAEKEANKTKTYATERNNSIEKAPTVTTKPANTAKAQSSITTSTEPAKNAPTTAKHLINNPDAIYVDDARLFFENGGNVDVVTFVPLLQNAKQSLDKGNNTNDSAIAALRNYLSKNDAFKSYYAELTSRREAEERKRHETLFVAVKNSEKPITDFIRMNVNSPKLDRYLNVLKDIQSINASISLSELNGLAKKITDLDKTFLEDRSLYSQTDHVQIAKKTAEQPSSILTGNGRDIELTNRCNNLDSEQSLQACTELLANNPKLIQARINRAEILLRLKNYALAMSDLNEAITEQPKNAQLYYLRGILSVQMAKRDDAIKDFSEAIRMFPNYSDAYLARANMFIESGSADKAIMDLDQSIKINPRGNDAHFLRGNLWLEKGDFQKAINDYTSAIHYFPDKPILYINRGAAYEKNKQYDQAIDDYLRIKNKFDNFMNAEANINRVQKLKKDQQEEKELNEQRSIIEEQNRKLAETAEIRKKGLDYAKESSTTWTLQQSKNELTDIKKLSLLSNQKSNDGTGFVQILGVCDGGTAVFTVTILGNENNRAPVVPGSSDLGIPVKYRVDDGQILSFHAPIDKFRNVFVMAKVSKERSNKGYINSKKIDEVNAARLFFGKEWDALQKLAGSSSDVLGVLDDRNWRVVAQVETSQGTIVAKLPLYQNEVRQLINSCS